MANLERSTLIKDRFIQVMNNGELNYDDELAIIKALFTRYSLMTIQDYADFSCKSYPGVQDMIKRGKLATIEISGKTFILKDLNV